MVGNLNIMSTQYKRINWVRRLEDFSFGCSSGFRLRQCLIAGILAIFTGISRLLPVTQWLSVTLLPSLRGGPSCAGPKGVAMRTSLGRWRLFTNWLFDSLTPDVPVVFTVGASSLKSSASIWRGVVFVTLMAGSIVPASSLAATIEGTKFVDSNVNDSWDGDELAFIHGGIIRLKAANAPSWLPPSQKFTGINGQYIFENVSSGDYKIWQYIDPTSSLAAALREDGTPLVKWASEEAALLITVTEGDEIIRQDNGLVMSVIDFPTPELGDDIQIQLGNAANRANNICSTPTITLSNSWPTVPPTGIDENAVVEIYGTVEVPISSPPVEVRAICNHGTLIGKDGGDLQIIFRELFANFSDGEVNGTNGVDKWMMPWWPRPGSSIILQQNLNLDCDPVEHPEDEGYCDFFGMFYNEGKVQAGHGESVLEGWWSSDLAGNGEGGSVTIFALNFIQQGTIAAGDGGKVKFQNSSDIPWPLPENRIGGQGGSLQIAAISGNLIATAQSFTASGNGGDVVVNDNACLPEASENCMYEVQGGQGGDLVAYSGANIVVQGTAYSGNSVYIEPETMLSGKDTHIIAKEDVVIFGGDNWELKLNNLSPEAITAGRNIILAVGEGGVVDLRNNNAKIFKAGVKVEIFANTILLDENVPLQDLIDAPSIGSYPSKIFFHVALSGQRQVEELADTTIPVEITISNVGPVEDTYTLNVSDSAGWTITNLPSSVTVEGLKRKNLTLNVTLPSTPSAKDVITITATSQTDSKVVAVMDIRAGVKDTSCSVWGVHDKGLNDSQLFTIHSTDLQNFEVVGLGNLHKDYDLESLDINPLTGELYMASSTDGIEPGHLYKFNPSNEDGNLVSVGDIGFTQVDSLSFHPEGVLWGWERGQGLLQINPITGFGELVIPHTEDVEDISWSVDGKLLYAVQHGELLVWDGNTLATVCSMPRETEGIEAISENMLMFGAHGDKNVYVIDVKNGCQEINNIPTPYNDIEGIAWSASTCPIQ